MAHIFLSQLKTVLNNYIDELEQIHFLFSRNPETDFTRKRKLTFKEYIQFMLLMQGKTVSNEILDFFTVRTVKISIHTAALQASS